jgi:hypothetical protein
MEIYTDQNDSAMQISAEPQQKVQTLSPRIVVQVVQY